MAINEIASLKKLGYEKQKAFAYLTCERLYPNYVFFSKKFSFGNPKVLRNGIDLMLEVIITNYSFTAESVSISDIEENTPAPEGYETVLASSALDACCVVIEAINFFNTPDFSKIEDISTIAIDSVDMYIQEIYNLDFNKDAEFQRKIDTHPLMIREIEVQKGIISYLEKIKTIERADISTLLMLQGSDLGNLGLPTT